MRGSRRLTGIAVGVGVLVLVLVCGALALLVSRGAPITLCHKRKCNNVRCNGRKISMPAPQRRLLCALVHKAKLIHNAAHLFAG